MLYLMKFTIWEIKTMGKVFVEENGIFQIDCTNALWATNEVNNVFKETGNWLADVDFVIETEEKLLLVEYKNANIDGASNPEAFNPKEDKKVNNVIKKFYDTLHYLTLKNKLKPKDFIYILEYPKGDKVTRGLLRNRLQKSLPFRLQNKFKNNRLIERLEVLSIDEWNEHSEYGAFPLTRV